MCLLRALALDKTLIGLQLCMWSGQPLFGHVVIDVRMLLIVQDRSGAYQSLSKLELARSCGD